MVAIPKHVNPNGAHGFTPFAEFVCPVHALPMLVTHSGLQRVCPNLECDQHVRLQGPRKADEEMVKSPVKPENNDQDRAKKIAEAMEKKKKAATAEGIVTPEKPDRKAKIPKEANMTTGKTKKEKAKEKPQEAADEELDENVKPKKEKKDEDMLSVSDIARALGLDPKRARAKLRGLGQAATEGRWPKVKRGSKKHQELIDLLTPSDSAAEEEVEEDEDEE